MDDSGNIRKFISDADAKAEGFRHKLSEEKAIALSELYPIDRLPQLMLEEYCTHILGGKVSTMEKLKLRQAFRFAIEFMQK